MWLRAGIRRGNVLPTGELQKWIILLLSILFLWGGRNTQGVCALNTLIGIYLLTIFTILYEKHGIQYVNVIMQYLKNVFSKSIHYTC